MQRRSVLVALLGTSVLAACRDATAPLAPADLDAPMFAVARQVTEQVMPGRILARLTGDSEVMRRVAFG